MQSGATAVINEKGICYTYIQATPGSAILLLHANIHVSVNLSPWYGFIFSKQKRISAFTNHKKISFFHVKY